MRKEKGEADMFTVVMIGIIVMLTMFYIKVLGWEREFTYISGILESVEAVKEEGGLLRDYFFVKLKFRGRPFTPVLRVTEKFKVGEAYEISFRDTESVMITHINRYRPGEHDEKK